MKWLTLMAFVVMGCKPKDTGNLDTQQDTQTSQDTSSEDSDTASEDTGPDVATGEYFCSWSEAGSIYDCLLDAEVIADPSNTYLLECSQSFIEGDPCAADGPLSYAGCCESNAVYWCENNVVMSYNCSDPDDFPGVL